MSLESIAVSLLCMASIIVLFIGLARITNDAEHPNAEELEQAAKGLRSRGILATQLDRALDRRGKKTDLAGELARADLTMTPAEFLMITMTAIIGTFGLGLIIFKVWYVAAPLGILGYLLPGWYLKFRQGRRQAAFSKQLPDALSLMSTSLRSGYSLLQSMELLSKELQPPIAVEFSRVVREIGLGLPLETAMNNMLGRMRNDDLDLLVTVVLIHHELGGNLSDILEIVSHTIRERVRIKGEIKVLTAQQQMAGYLVGAMPFGLAVVLFLINPSYMGLLFNTLCGQLIFFVALAFVALALLLIRRIVNIEV